ncbi:MAG: HlyD family efflux transporter periplasmic adaptor subunit, partial [Oscillospiraceae bacterium]|nr:HlyD family efflux transporter periplasmic adaptor subunit [Oscillospiraceae bacterium]
IVLTLILPASPFGGGKKADAQSYEFIRTVTLQKDTLREVVSTTGTVDSGLTSTVTYSPVSNTRTPKVKSVNFAVGDAVEVGDVIVELDTKTVDEAIAKELESLEEKRKDHAKRIANAKEDYDEAVETYDETYDEYLQAQEELLDAENEYFDLEEAYFDAEDEIEHYQDNYDDAVAEEADLSPTYLKYKLRYEDCSDELTEAQDALEEAEEAYENAEEDDDLDRLERDLEDAREELTYAEEAFLNAQERYLDIKEEYDTACDELSIAKQELQSAKTLCDYDTLKSDYEAAEREYESAESQAESLESKVKSAEKSMKNALDNYNEALEDDVSTSDTLDDLYEDLENCSLKAETAGKITALNVNVGDTPAGTIATINDTEMLKVAITIAEADINSVELGMQCLIFSDATDGEIFGTLVQIDPTTEAAGSFGAEVLITTENTGLKIGMNASVDIIISSTENCFMVPRDAVGHDEDGDFVYRKTGGEGVDMTFEKVYITTGDSNDFYIEISADTLSEGDIIRASSDLTQGLEVSDAAEEELPFGTMPSGGFHAGGMGGGMPSGGFHSGGMPSGGGMRP